MGDLEGGKTYFGYPAMPQKEAFKQLAIMRKLPEMYKEFKNLQKELEETKKLSFWGKLKKMMER